MLITKTTNLWRTSIKLVTPVLWLLFWKPLVQMARQIYTVVSKAINLKYYNHTLGKTQILVN